MTERYQFNEDGIPVKNNVLIVFDGHSYFHRAYNVVINNEDLSEADIIKNVSNLYLDMIDRVIDKISHNEFIIIFDTNRETLHKKLIYKEYKANRATPTDLQKRCERSLMDTLLNSEYPYYSIEGYEADQIISAICVLAEKKNIFTIIATKDKDLYELLKYSDVLIYDKHQLHDKKSAIEKFNVEPNQIGDYLSLVGDKADNIPGVSNVGGKTASKLLQEYSTLESIYNNLEKLSEKIKENLVRDKENAFLSKELTDLTPDDTLLGLIKTNLIYLR